MTQEIETVSLDYARIEELGIQMTKVIESKGATVIQAEGAAALVLARIFMAGKSQQGNMDQEIKFIQDLLSYGGLYFSDEGAASVN